MPVFIEKTVSDTPFNGMWGISYGDENRPKMVYRDMNNVSTALLSITLTSSFMEGQIFINGYGPTAKLSGKVPMKLENAEGSKSFKRTLKIKSQDNRSVGAICAVKRHSFRMSVGTTLKTLFSMLEAGMIYCEFSVPLDGKMISFEIPRANFQEIYSDYKNLIKRK